MDSVPDLGSYQGERGADSQDPGARATATEELTDQECWDYLTVVQIGRLAVYAAGDVDIHPFTCVLDDGSVVLSAVAGACREEFAVSGRAAFEVDGYDADTGTMWSVTVKGSVVSWERQCVRMFPERITGCRFTVPPDRDGSVEEGYDAVLRSDGRQS